MKALLLGDVCPTYVTAPLFEEKNIKTLFGDTVSLFKENDINFVNMECVITDFDIGIKKFGPNLKCPRQTAEVLKQVGVNYCGLSNNHIFDFGIQGIKDTMQSLDDACIEYTGFGENYADSRKNLVIEKDGEKVCIIAVCEHEYSYALENRMGSRPYDEYDTIEDIRKAKADNDRVIVIYHGGKELCRYPSPRLYKACRAMVDNGADVVLCQHSHCIGCYENYNGSHILYGQGNFHFVKPTDYADLWNSSLAVKYDTATNKMEFVPLINTENGIMFAEGDDKFRIMSAFEERNNELISGEWKFGWHNFCESMKKNYINVIKKACNDNSTDTQNSLFGHYLDCEAHTDVWKELFPTYNQTNELE